MTSAPESNFGDTGDRTVSESVSVTIALPSSDFGNVGTQTISEEAPIETSIFNDIETFTQVTLGITILTDAKGSPVTTSTISPSAISFLEEITETNSRGQPTATKVLTVVITPSLSTETDSQGNPTATIASYPTPPVTHTVVYHSDFTRDLYQDDNSQQRALLTIIVTVSSGQYFTGMFLPTLVTSLLAIAVRILGANAKAFQPWHALTNERGAPGRDSLYLQTGGWKSIAISVRSLLGGQAVVFLTSLLSLLSLLLVPLSAEAIALDLRGDGCKKGATNARNCAWVLSSFSQPTKATLAVLVVMSAATICLIGLLARWRLGVYTNPWSICTLASLSLNHDVRKLVTSAAAGTEMNKAQRKYAGRLVKERTFKLETFSRSNGSMEYGVVALNDLDDAAFEYQHEGDNESLPLHNEIEQNNVAKRKHRIPFFMLSVLGRLFLLFLLCGVLILILYYSQTGGNTGFERFIDSDSYGVRFLFTSLGVIISSAWSSFFDSVAILAPYQLLARKPQPAGRSILLAPPTNAFSGLWYAIRTRRIFIAVVALASILSESLGTFLSNVPFQVTQTFTVYRLSIWTAVSILSLMVLTVILSFRVKWPHMPVDPSTIAGAMYYVCNSPLLEKMEGLSTLEKKERDRRISELGLLYEFGEMEGTSGGRLSGINIFYTDSMIPEQRWPEAQLQVPYISMTTR
ncbi:hypothetical protein HD806DRAFT_522505 [Xylariaceae sp. AK1471]|nr:hypothetical protein HD806DRAFT_522505 [Xylariaceae sp. AK1471]